MNETFLIGFLDHGVSSGVMSLVLTSTKKRENDNSAAFNGNKVLKYERILLVTALSVSPHKLNGRVPIDLAYPALKARHLDHQSPLAKLGDC
jgi:hypothetical protein